MPKKQDLLDMSAIDTEVLNRAKKKKEKSEEGKVASPATKMFTKTNSGGNILERTMQKSGEKFELQSQIAHLKQELDEKSETISLKMPVSGITVNFKKCWLDPDLIDVSPENQRDQSLLDLSAVSDIFDSIEAEGQSEPGYVLPKSEGRYELVSGSRRLFCVKNIPRRKYLSLVGRIPEVDVRRLSRLENQQAPISVYERAISFQQDIKNKRVKTWDALAAMEGISSRQIKKYKALADLPIEIVRSFGSPSDLSLEFADWLISKIRKNDELKEKIIGLASDIYKDKVLRSNENQAKRPAPEVIAEFKRVIRLKRSPQPTIKKPVVYTGRNGKEIFRHTISNKGTQKLELIDCNEGSLEVILNAIKKELGVASL